MEPELSCAVVWADPDLLELEVGVCFGGWAGRERAYVARDELAGFAEALSGVADGGSEALLEAGQPDLSWARLRVREYGRARRLAVDVWLGRAAGTVSSLGEFNAASELRLSVPVERGPLAHFAARLRAAGEAERGEARLALPSDWPS